MNRREALQSLGLLATIALPTISGAQTTYPTRPVTLIVPYSPGGATDNVARVIAQHLQSALGQPVIIDNRAGANGRIGTNAVAQAKPNGYVLLLGGIGPITIAPHLESVPYDPFNDFQPISLLVKNDVVLLVNPSVPADDVATLIKYLKANPGKLNYASSGTGGPFHLSGELFKSMAEVDLIHVPYKGDAPALADLIAGNTQVMFTTISACRQYIESKRVKAIASAGTERSSRLPDLPTISESGLPGFSSETWQALFAPAGTPPDIINALEASLIKTMKVPALRTALQDQGNSVVGGGQAECRQFIKAEYDKWGDVVAKARISAS